MPTKETALQAILDQGLLPLFFYEDPQVSLEIIQTLYKAGVRTLEYTNRGPAALENFKYLKQELQQYPDLHLGIGTIKTEAQANDFLKAGADYIVAPIVDPAVGSLVHEAGLLWIPGCFTPTEIHVAQQAEAALIKIFPANIVGPAFVSSIKELFPGQLFIPTGGVEMEENNFKTWFKSGVCAVGMGSKLISKDILANRQYDQLHTLTQQALHLAQTCRL
ncbi:bifunctional 4-hydroxy-2-oxoglutarate aldolase/2-dehydro-3-deoxy-phosphogluconate aldolase [Nibribacter ruber]|uniref:Bifunctional 4-hydroxy-2-oxoglutarate aldolase/2-dehydro-3-deoxy-phosphogluconate aldolase n=1 Tax=Nibribacter ruber TaxID=2698458 RepID=A0A6P1P099_9BACT|nr:bifunctional 4-hydroxy-2-oxoglutarate aldolase/2-dehydro-3-deoxy-phosphogluconate aldolase [Nibribacter ruber]QHL86743.1 bifunctional 4-hydroxy-2-oxoglutarate aldolase/2-dehydro-3-deoxy-phosphogluconate aldolase [Nibribacter ruber]